MGDPWCAALIAILPVGGTGIFGKYKSLALIGGFGQAVYTICEEHCA
jgi:hypothetical protein